MLRFAGFQRRFLALGDHLGGVLAGGGLLCGGRLRFP
jgi:hypothetical protein